MFWNFPTMHSLKFYACISVYTYTLITILLELRKLWFSKDFTMDLKGKNPGGHWWKWERLKLGTLEKELSYLNISNRIYNQTFISFIFLQEEKSYHSQRKRKRINDIKMKNCLLQLLVQVTGISNRTLTELSTISSITHRVGVLGYDSILKKKMFRHDIGIRIGRW